MGCRSFILPFVPGSYTVKATKVVKRSKRVSKVVTKVPSTLTDLRKGRYLSIGKYNALQKLYRGAKSRRNIELHHIIEKRFAKVFRFDPKYWPAVAIDKDVHKIITKRFRDAYEYNTKRKSNHYSKLRKVDMQNIVKEVYKDMPELRKAALKQINEQYRRRR